MLKDFKKVLAMGLSLTLITTSSYGYRNPEPVPEAGGATDGAPMSPSELDALVAPIALYPDALVAQILAAATFPDQVAVADYCVHQNLDLTGKSLLKAVDKQSWDSSVKALTEFPSVLNNLAKNLTWTSSLGEAYHNQPSEVMEAIQTLRAKAKAAGNLKSSPQITVVQQTPQTIVIQPANPLIVYVPEYNPAIIFGTPYVIPGYTAADVAAAGLLGFGAGIAVGALAGGGWGWNSWNCDWHSGAVVYNHNNFYGNAAWHGGYYNGGYHAGYHNAYNRTQSITSIARILTTSTPTVRTHGPTTIALSENRAHSVAGVIIPAVLAAGRREPTASAAGGACAPGGSAAADSEVAASAVVVSAAVDFDVKPPLKGYLCRTPFRTTRC